MRFACQTPLVLLLEAPSAETAKRFFRVNPRDPSESVSLAAGDVESRVLLRWARAAAHGAAFDSDAYPQGTTDADLAVRRDRLAEVFREEGELLGPLAEQLAARSLVAIVADPDGVILAAHGSSSFDHPAARVRLTPGARWSEDVRGTNAIGTALVERRPVAVVGGAHYELRNHGLFCYAHPIFDGYGDVVAVLDVTGPVERHDPAVGVAVHAAGMSLERALRRLAYAQSGAGTIAAIERLVARSSSATLLVEASGRVGAINAHAREALGIDEGASLRSDQVFGLSFAELQRMVVGSEHARRDLRFETAQATYHVELDPLFGARGRALAVLVHLEREGVRRVQVRSGRQGSAAQLTSAARLADLPSPTSSAAGGAGSTRTPVAPHPAFDVAFGDDPAFVAAKSSATRFARAALPVLLLAETGTGKELFARAIHAASARADGPFIPLNCGALAGSVLESELFGYGPGAFTGASRTGADGKLAAADRGTLFLDEIAEMPDALQAALLRVLDDGVYFRVGEARARRSDFRLVCATCRDLPALVAEGKFRRDLFYRIHGASIVIPSLRVRTDRLVLADSLLATLAPARTLHLADDACQWILTHDWPGNVRELKSALVHAAALAEDGVILAEDFPRVLLDSTAPPAPASTPHAVETPAPSSVAVASGETPRPRTRVAIINEAILDALRDSAGNVSEAARRLGVARTTVYRVLRGVSR